MTKYEIRILQTLWENDRPMCSYEIAKENPDIKDITLQSTLKRMLENDLLVVGGKVRRTKNYARAYLPNISEETVEAMRVAALPKKSPVNFIYALLENSNLTPKEAELLKAVIDERTKK